MRGRILVAVLACYLADGAAWGGEIKADSARLQGTWRPVRLERAGKPPQVDFFPSARVVVRGDVIRFQAGDEVVQELRFTLDPRLTPRTIDLVSLSGPTKGKVLRGIYRVEGRRLTLCWPLDGDARRPTDFGPKGAGDLVTFTFQREEAPVVQSRGSGTWVGLRHTRHSGRSDRR